MNKPISGYQEILDQNILYIIIETLEHQFHLHGQKPCVCSNLLYEIYIQLQSENRCTKLKEKYFINNAIKRQMHQNKRKILYKQIQSENRCTKMRIGIYTKQIGNCLDNLVLAKQVPQFMKTLSKINSEKESHFSQSKPRRPCNILQ